MKSPRLQKKKRIKILAKAFLALFLASSLLVGIYFLLRIPFLTISSVSVSGTEVIDPKDVAQKADSMISGSSYFFIPLRNVLFYPRSAIEKYLSANFPRIESVYVGLDKNILNITIKEKKAFALWCSDSCYFLDSSGDIFSPAPDFSGSVYKIFSGSIQGDPLGKIFMGEKTLSGIKKIYDASEDLGIRVSRVEASSTKEIRLESDGGVSLIVDLSEDPDEIISDLQTVVNSDEFKLGKISVKNLEYIDLRFGSKVFFKIKGLGGSASSTLSEK